MRPHPWGAAPAMALAAAAELLAAMAHEIGEDESGTRLDALASIVREATERTYWLPDDGYYAAARARVDDRLY